MTASAVNVVKTETLYRGFMQLKRYHLQHHLFNGGWSAVFTRELLVRSEVAAVLPYDPQLDKVVLIEQFRVGALADSTVRPWLMEIVAGLRQADESLSALAMRETDEEAGLVPLALMPMCRYWVSPGMTNERVQLFCAHVNAHHAGGIHGLTEENEDIRVHVCSLTEALGQIDSGEICNAITIIALQWLMLHRDAVNCFFSEQAKNNKD